MTKGQARRLFRSRRTELGKEQINNQSRQIFKEFTSFNKFFPTLHTFLPILKNNEVNTWLYINEFKPAGQRLVISKTDFINHSMRHFIFESEEYIKENKMGIPEPVKGTEVSVNDIDAVFIPLLGCDRDGNRVGYGKGYYDEFLKDLQPDTPKIGLSFFDPLDLIFEDIEEHDVPLDYCITPFETVRF